MVLLLDPKIGDLRIESHVGKVDENFFRDPGSTTDESQPQITYIPSNNASLFPCPEK